MLTENLLKVKERLADACQKAGRDPGSVTLIAVSKTKPAEDIRTLYEAGHRDFGENYVQELREKYETLPKDIRWHMIGHLQRNKVKYIAPYIACIHSVDSAALAETIDKEAKKCGRIIPVLIEVNMGGEESKFGVSPEELPALLSQIEGLPNIRIDGLMTSAPLTDDADLLHFLFASMRKLDLDMTSKNYNNYKGYTLSMGMSNDYLIAAAEGATCVRVGTEIFGRRNYTQNTEK